MGNDIWLSERSLARKLLAHFTEKGVIEVVGDRHHSSTLYTVTAAALATVKVAAPDAKAAAAKGTKKKWIDLKFKQFKYDNYP